MCCWCECGAIHWYMANIADTWPMLSENWPSPLQKPSNVCSPSGDFWNPHPCLCRNMDWLCLVLASTAEEFVSVAVLLCLSDTVLSWFSLPFGPDSHSAPIAMIFSKLCGKGIWYRYPIYDWALNKRWIFILIAKYLFALITCVQVCCLCMGMCM